MEALDFGQWLTRKRREKAMREGRRVTMSELARDTGYSRQYIGFIEAGVNPSTGKPIRPDREAVCAIARALGAPEEDALEAAGYSPDFPPRIAEVARKMRKLSDSELDAVRHLVECMASDPYGVGSGARSAAPALGMG